ncbi:hypothetical protein Vi05172_g9841 [Venturia inaequalis]|nr:hypothetical protein Vi05172_g9841 [Venturia inaequalis]
MPASMASAKIDTEQALWLQHVGLFEGYADALERNLARTGSWTPITIAANGFGGPEVGRLLLL